MIAVSDSGFQGAVDEMKEADCGDEAASKAASAVGVAALVRCRKNS